MKKLFITGSSGLIGSEVCHYFSRKLGYEIHGVDIIQAGEFVAGSRKIKLLHN